MPVLVGGWGRSGAWFLRLRAASAAQGWQAGPVRPDGGLLLPSGGRSWGGGQSEWSLSLVLRGHGPIRDGITLTPAFHLHSFPRSRLHPQSQWGLGVQGAQFRLWLNTVQLGAIQIVSTHTGREPQRRQFEKVH